ncbi:unnamed protein product [Schistosoma turkestanicum]|nr:unnamed protein product [Schistosoma turkestanicum]
MVDQQIHGLDLIKKRFSAFCIKEGIKCDVQYSSETTFNTNWTDALLYLCSNLPNRKLQLDFLDTILKTALPLDEKVMFQIVKYVLKIFQDLKESNDVQGIQYDAVLSSCAQLMVHCLTYSHTLSDSYSLFMDVIDHIKSIISHSSTVECLIGYAVLFINIVKLERKNNYLTEILDILNEYEDSPPLDTTGNLSFLCQLFHSNKSQAQLAILIALIGILTSNDWFCNYKNCGSISLYILSMAGFTSDSTDYIIKKFDRNDSITNLLLSKLVYNWSKKNLLNASEKNDQETNIQQCIMSMNPILTFCIEMRSNYIDAIRYSALDTFENIVFYHLKYCHECCQPRISSNNNTLKISCDHLNKILHQLISDSCYSRGTIAMLTRFVRCICKKKLYKIVNFLHFLDSICQPFANDTNLGLCGRVVSGLMKIANDPNLASSIAELYTLIAQNLWINNDPLINTWLSGLVDNLIHNSNETFHSTINQNILPSLMKTNPKLLEILVKCYNNDSVSRDTNLYMFQLTCYHLLSLNGMKTDCCEHLSLNFLTSCLVSYDNQLRITALNVLVSSITKSKQKLILSNEKLEMFLNYLKRDLWPNSKHIHDQIVSAIKDILLHTLSIIKRGITTTNLSNLELFCVKLVHTLMTCIYPGSPASRLSLGLAGLYTVIECFYSMFYTDCNTEFTKRIMSCLNEATKGLFTLALSSSEDFKSINQSTLQLFSILMIGLCSRYDVDRDYAVKILLRLNILPQLNPNYINKLWTDTLEIYAQCSKPDINPIAGDLLRLLIYSNENINQTNCLSTSSSSIVNMKVIQAIDYLLNQLEEQIIMCEKFPVNGLMSVVINKPFYAMLNTIRSIIGIASSTSLSKKDKNSINLQIWKCTSIKAESLFKQINGVNCMERIISLGLRISEIVLPVVGHESPEGVLLTSKEDVIIDDIKIENEQADHLYKLSEKTRKYPEYLILCCWRSVRELSLLMGISLISYGFNNSNSDQMKPKEIFSIAQFFCTQLLCCRHRGAFELCATGFTNFCTALVNHPVYCSIPIHWLNVITGQSVLFNEKSTNNNSTVIENIDFSLKSCMGKHDIVECITRRGAGCPLFVQAILSADLTRSTNVPTTSLTSTVYWFLKSIKTSICNNNLQQFNNLSTCVLHLNIIRGIFQSTNLNYHIDKYLQKALIIALNGIGCSHLPIRNASILFYSTIVQRIFGVKRSKAVKSRKNCLATSTFFKLYPKLENYLVETLTWYSRNTNIPRASCFKLYSILHLMTHLLPSTQVSEIDKTLCKLLIRCGFNNDIRIRKIASLALTSIIHPNIIMITLNHLFNLMELVHQSILVKKLCKFQLNILHSLLLQIYALIYSNMDIHGSISPVYTVSTMPYISKLNYLTIINRLKVSFNWVNNSTYIKCPIIKQLYMKILNCHYNQSTKIETNLIGLEYESFETYINVMIDCALNNAENHTLTTTTNNNNNNTFYLDLMKWTKSIHSLNLVKIALRRICSHLHSTLGHHSMLDVNYNFDIEDINEIIDISQYLNCSIFTTLKTLFSFQTLFQDIIYPYFCLNENTPHNSNNNEVYRYTFALLTIQLYQQQQQQQHVHNAMSISMELILTAFHWTCKQIKFLHQKVKCFNNIPPIYLASLIRFHTELIFNLYNNKIDDLALESYVYELCDLGNICFNAFNHSNTTPICLEVKYAVLKSFCLLNNSTVQQISSTLNENIRHVFLQSFDILIDTLNNSENSKLQKQACHTVSHILISSDLKFQYVLQSPYILLENLIKFLLLHGSHILYNHLLLFLQKKIHHFEELQVSHSFSALDEHAFPQTTMKLENDQFELIQIISNNIMKWIQSKFHVSDCFRHENNVIDYNDNNNQSLRRYIDCNELVSFLIFELDYTSLLFLNNYIDYYVIKLL